MSAPHYCLPTDPALSNGLVGYWKFDEGTGNMAFDYSGNMNHGILINSPTWVSGVSGSALQFNGVNQYVNATNNNALQLYTGTVSAWIKTSNPGSSYRGIVVKQNAYGMFLLDNVFGIYDWKASSFRSTGINLADNSWHQVVFTFQSGISGATVLYIDGQPVLTTMLTVSAQSVGVAIAAGNNPATMQFFNGIIDDVRIYNRVLSASEIQELYQGI